MFAARRILLTTDASAMWIMADNSSVSLTRDDSDLMVTVRWISTLVRRTPIGEHGVEHLTTEWHWFAIPGKTSHVTDAQLEAAIGGVINRSITALGMFQTASAESDVRSSINRSRAKTIGKPSYIPELPPFIHVTDQHREPSGHMGGTHASPIPHDRRGHWRTYKASGRRVWIKDQRILGGSSVPRHYAIS